MHDELKPHLEEIKRRLIYCLIVYSFTLCIFLYFIDPIFNLLAKPILNSLPKNSHLIVTEITSSFTTPLKLSLHLSLITIIPLCLSQVWLFIRPALYKREKKAITPVVLSSICLFYLGMFFAYFLAIPLAVNFFTNIAPSNVLVMTSINSYIDFLLSMLMIFGLSFQIPIIIYTILINNIMKIETLTEKRPIIIIMAFTLGMLLTPPDVISQILLAVPMLFLFELGIMSAKYKLNRR